MAKRYTDTEKWKDDWFVSLGNDYRIIWQWLLDNCNHAGICKRSIKLLNFMCNTTISEDELVKEMEGRLLIKDNIWFIPKFLKFQYSTLKSNKPVIVSVVKELKINNLLNLIPESFGNDYIIVDESLDNDCIMIKDKDTDKDKDMVKDKSNYKNEKENNLTIADSNLFRKPNIPTKESVWEVFQKNGASKEMAKSFYEKYESVGWITNAGVITNFVPLANKFIANWYLIEEKNKKNNQPFDPTKVKIVLK
jgi:hypothetical protein